MQLDNDFVRRGLKMPWHVVINHKKYAVLNVSPEAVTQRVVVRDSMKPRPFSQRRLLGINRVR
jgi:hypothetical protein